MKKRIISILMAAIMIMTLLPVAAFAAGYTDTQGHWGESAIDRWSGYGIVSGKGNGVFDPNGPMKRGEAAQVFANLFRLTAKADLSGFTDVGLGKWYDDAIAKCVKAGIMSGKGKGVMDPESTITREEFFVMFANALGIKPEKTTELTVADGAQAASWAAGYINALINRGFVQGTGYLQPKLNINRASVMALLNQTIKTYVNTTEKVTAGDGLTLIVVDNANVTFAEGTENAEVYVFGKNAVITNAPVGTVIVTSESATGTKVNGKAFSSDAVTIVGEAKPAGEGRGRGSNTPAATKYTVSFDVQGHGTTPAAITVPSGEKIPTGSAITSGAAITTPGAVSADGYTFVGWYKEATCENRWDFDTDIVTGNITLYAKWESDDKTIAEILATVDEFPTSSNSTPVPAPDTAWITTNGEKCYIWGNYLYFAKAEGNSVTSISKNNTVEEFEGNYVSDFSMQTIGNITFNMKEGVLTEITVENYEGFNGTYSAPAPVESVLWTGEAIADDFRDQPFLLSDGGTELQNANASAGDVIKFYVEPIVNETPWYVKIEEGHLELASPYIALCSVGADTNDGKFVEYDLAANNGSISMPLTQEILDTACTRQYWGGSFMLNGDNIKCTKITLVK